MSRWNTHGVGYTRSVRSVNTLGVVVAGGGRVSATGWVGPVVTVAVDSGVGGVGDAGVVCAVCAFRGLTGLVAVESVLNLVDESRHVGWLCLVVSCLCWV